MTNRNNHKPVKTVFRTFFRKSYLNRMIRNLLIEVPDVPRLMTRARQRWVAITSPLVRKLNKSRWQHRAVNIVDLDVLQQVLAARVKKPHTKTINISARANIHFEQVRLKDILASQEKLLQEMLRQQRSVLREQTDKIIQEEKEKRRGKYQSNTRNA